MRQEEEERKRQEEEEEKKKAKKTVKKVISKVIEENPMALKNPEPFVRLSAHNDSALTYTVRIWCKNADYWDVNFDTIENVKKAFDASYGE